MLIEFKSKSNLFSYKIGKLIPCSKEHSRICEVLEIIVGKEFLYKLFLFFQYGCHDVQNVIVEGNLCHLLIFIINCIDKEYILSNADKKYFNLAMHLIAVLPLVSLKSFTMLERAPISSYG